MKKRIAGMLMALTVFVSSVGVFADSEYTLPSEYGTEHMAETETVSEDKEQTGLEKPDVSEEIPDNSVDEDILESEEAEGENANEEDWNQEDAAQQEETMQSEETTSSEDSMLSEDPMPSEEPEYTVFSEENAGLLKGETEEDQQLIQEIEDGQILAFSPAMSDETEEDENADVLSGAEEGIAVIALKPGEYYVETTGRVYCDEVWTPANDFVQGNHTRMASTFRRVHYIDDTGAEKTAPLYCLKATKTGLDSVTLKNEAVKVLKNATIQKLLYYGYGGPGDLGTSYDPSCSHIKWSNWQNRFMFTHIALSKVYFNDRGYATEAEVEHVGINRMISKIKAMTIPARNKASVSAYGEDGWTTAAGKTVPMSVFRSRPDHYPYVPDSMKDGFQMSPLMKVTDSAGIGNGITITRTSSEKWQLAYWNNSTEYNAKKTKPTMMTGTSLKLKAGAYFMMIFPLNTTASKKFQCKMLLQPVSYILVDGKTQTGKDGIQDFGAYVYQGTRGTVTFTLKPSAYGSTKLTKTETNTGQKIAGAEYTLYAAEILKSGYRTFYQEDQKIASAVTDSEGVITFPKLYPGKYYVKETKAPKGYVLSTEVKNITVTGGKTTAVSVKEIMDITGTVSIAKKDGDTDDPLAGAEFTLYTWSKKSGSYSKTGKLLKYDGQARRYKSDEFVYTADNQGKFRVKETKPPKGYTGNWQKDIKLTDAGTHKEFFFEVVNYQKNKRKIEIMKTDEDTGEVLKDAEFTLYEYSTSRKGYKKNGVLLKYDSKSQMYASEELLMTADNAGKFCIKETKNPKGYEGGWEKEVDVTDEDASFYYEVTNKAIPDYTGVLRIQKTDIYTGEVLEGAEFTLYQWNQAKKAYENNLDEKKLMKYDSDTKKYESQKLLITEENQGKFRVVETKNPENYLGTYQKDLVFQKKEDGDTLTDEIELKVQNTPKTVPLGKITIRKKIKEEDITWAHGNPTFFFVAEGKDLSGAFHRYEDYVTFAPESYQTDENGYALLSVTLDHVPLGQYEIWEKPVLRYYLKNAYANTQNVQITKGAAPAYGTDPKEIAAGTAALTVKNRKATITFVNEKTRYDRYSHNDCVKNTVPLLFS